MVSRLCVALTVGVVACGSLAGCREAGPAAAPVTPSQYLAAVESLLDPPGRLASIISQEADADADAAPIATRRRLGDLVDRARARLAEFRALRLQDAVIRRQRDRLAGAYARLIPHMQTAAAALVDGDRTDIVRASGPFLDALRTLPSAATR